MALSSTIYRIQIALSDVDRGVYEALDLRLARHPSENMRYLLTRTVAYCLLYEEGISFGKGLSEADDPALSVRDLRGDLRAWIDVGTPSPERLHRASKAAGRVVIFTQNDPEQLGKQARGKVIHRASEIEVYVLAPAFLDALDAVTDRNARWELVHTSGQLYVTSQGKVIEGEVGRYALPDG
jgi:uncharacterized protein YaeQ